MAAMWDDFFEPQNDAEREIAAIEALSVSVQLAIQKAMMDQGISQKALAERLGISPARVSQILSSHGSNLTIKTLGRIAAALGENFDFVRRQKSKRIETEPLEKFAVEAVRSAALTRKYHWEQSCANSNDSPLKSIAA